MVKMLRSRLSARHRRLMELLVEARTRAGMTQQDLSKLLDRPQSYVSKFESGERRLDLVELIEILEALGQKPEEITALVLALLAAH